MMDLLFAGLGTAVGFVCWTLPRLATWPSLFVRRWLSWGIAMAFLYGTILAIRGDFEDYGWWAFIGFFLFGPITYFATRLFVRVFTRR
jgi:hypothetical protein